MKIKQMKHIMGIKLAIKVPVFLAVVVVIFFLPLRVSKVLLSIKLNTHMARNGAEVSTAFSAILNLRICFIYRGSSISTMYQPQFEHVCATRIAQNGKEVRTARHGTAAFYLKKITFYSVDIKHTKKLLIKNYYLILLL